MNSHIVTRWMVVSVCLLMSSCNEDSHRQTTRSTTDESNEQRSDRGESFREPEGSSSTPSSETLESQSKKTVRAKKASALKTAYDALWFGFPDRALEIMKADPPKWIARKDQDSRTPLHIAARFEHIEVVKWLLKNGADVNAIAYNGFTPLHLTSQQKVIELISCEESRLEHPVSHSKANTVAGCSRQSQ